MSYAGNAYGSTPYGGAHLEPGGDVTGTLTATLPPLTVALSGTSQTNVTGTLAVSLPALSADLSGVVQAANSLTVTLPALSVSLVGEVGDAPAMTDTRNRVAGRSRGGYALVEWEPPVVAPPMPLVTHAQETALAYDEPVYAGGQLRLPNPVKATATRHRDRVLIGGKDVTYFRGAETTASFRLIQPLSYGAATVNLPQVHSAYEALGAGRLKWLRVGKPVIIQRVDVETNEVVATDYRGFITGFDIGERGLVANVGGEVSGRAALRHRPVPVFDVTRDAGRLLARSLQTVTPGRVKPALGEDTGITIHRFGGMTFLDYINQLVAMMVDDDGNQWTVGRRANGTWGMWLKDRTTIHATVYFDNAMAPQLSRDISEEPNRVFANAVAKDGRRVNFNVYPGLVQGEAPPWPYASNGATFGAGTTNADTDAPEDKPINALINRLDVMGYLAREDAVAIEFDGAVTRAVKALQRDANLTVTGVVNKATWRAAFDLDATGYSLAAATTLPAAQRSYVKPWNLTSSGARSTRNPDHDPHAIVVDRAVSMGNGFDGPQVREFSRDLLDDRSGNWTGTLTAHLALIRGEHTPGTPIGDLMPAREVRPGMNIWAPHFDGGTLFHVSGVEVPDGGRAPTFTLDTRARDTMEAWEVITRNRESRRSPARAWVNQYRSSTVQKDALTGWEAKSGKVTDRVRCPGGEWTVFPVVAGQEGTVRRLRLVLEDPTRFAVMVFGREVSAAALNSRRSAPLSEAGTEKLDKPAFAKWARGRFLLASWGQFEQAAGYGDGQQTGDDGEPSGDPVTGVLDTDASFSYHTFNAGVLWVAVWPVNTATVQPGRVMWNQFEEGS